MRFLTLLVMNELKYEKQCSTIKLIQVMCGIMSSVVPDKAISEMLTPNSYDMKPRTENIAKPAMKLVMLFNRHRAKASLQWTKIQLFTESYKNRHSIIQGTNISFPHL